MFSKGHFRGKPAEAKQPEAAKPKEPEAKQPSEHGTEHAAEHTSKTHGTKPHPVTGVHAVHIHHHGEGQSVKTHTHHDGGNVEEREHNSMEEAHAHAQQQLPDTGAEPQDDYDRDEQAPDDGSAMSSLGTLGSE